MASDAGHGNFDLALGVREPFDFYDFHGDVPRSDWLEVLIFGNDADRVVALGLAGMLAVGGVVGKVTNLLAWWTISLVAVMRVRVVTFRMDSARKSALGGADLLLAATRNFLSCPGASTLDRGFLVARIARSVMAEGRALVFAAG